MGNPRRRGKLQQKFYSLVKKHKKSGLHLEKNPKNPELDVSQGEIIISVENYKDDIEWLRNNNTPEILIIEKWNNTFEYRKQQYKTINVFEEWPILKQQLGQALVSIGVTFFMYLG